MIQSWRSSVNKRLGELEAVRQRTKIEKKALNAAEDHTEAVQQAQLLTQQVAEKIQQEAHNQIAGVVTRCLSAVFDDPYTFHLRFRRQRGRTEARLIFERDGLEVDPMTAAGGGVVDVASFALRLSCLLLNQPPLRRFLALDEPFKFLSKDCRPRMRELLEQLSSELGVQFLMVTHIGEFQAGKVVEL